MASGNTLVVFDPHEGRVPSSAFPQQNYRNGHPTMDYDAAAIETANFVGVIPKLYAGGGLTVRIRWAGATATTGDVKWNGLIERIDTGTLDIDADSFASAQTTTTTTSGTSGVRVETVITYTSGANMDSLAAGEEFRFQLTRDATAGGDTMAGDAQVTGIVIEET